MVRNGKYLRSCKGFLYLFTCEIINNSDDPKENLRLLSNVVKVYGSVDKKLLDSMADACFTYAKLHRLKDPKVGRGYEWTIIAHEMTECLSADPIDPIPQGIVMEFMKRSDLAYVDPNVPYGELFTRILRDIEDMERHGPGTRLVDVMGTRARIQYDVYPEFEYFGDKRRTMVQTLKFSSDSSARRFIRATMLTLLREVRCKTGKNAPLPIEYPSRYRSIVKRAVDDWHAGRWKPEDLEPEIFVLDKVSVKRAASDLDAVSEMMATEEEEDVPVIEDEIQEESEAEGPWETFASSLDIREMGYIEAALQGKGKEFARNNGMRLTAIEESINAKAMDHVGDIVVEDGNVISDYRQELEGMY